MVLGATTDAVAAWSTFAAVMLALFGPLARSMWKRLRRPRLTVTFGNTVPLKTVEPSHLDPKQTVVRALVRNEGRTEARRVRAQVRHLWLKVDVPMHGPPWRDLVVLPLPLGWASRVLATQPSDAETTELAAGSDDYVTVSRLSFGDGDPKHEIGSLGPGMNRVETRYDVGEYRIEVTVSAQNAPTVSAVVRYRVELASRELRPERSERPPATETQIGGALGISDGGDTAGR